MIALSGTYGQILELCRLGRFPLLRPDRRGALRLPLAASRNPPGFRAPGHPITTGSSSSPASSIVVATVATNIVNSLIGYAILLAGHSGLPSSGSARTEDRMTGPRSCSRITCTGPSSRRPCAIALTTSEVPHFRMDRLPIDLADLDMDGASHPRYAPLREAIGKRYGVAGRAAWSPPTARRWRISWRWPR